MGGPRPKSRRFSGGDDSFHKNLATSVRNAHVLLTSFDGSIQAATLRFSKAPSTGLGYNQIPESYKLST